MPEEVHFAIDAGTVAFRKDAPGISVENDSIVIDWDDVEVVRVDDVPWADAFNTKEFYKLPATVAKPVKQQYMFGQDMVTLMKPREELKKAAWSLHNAPWTLNHPNGSMVKDVNDIKGFWRDPRYIDSLDDLDADLHIPVNDDEAKQFVESNGDVSVGFYNRMVSVDSYDGVVGGGDDRDGVQAYQTNLYFDHVASVRVGRCSSEAGCGLHDGGNTGEYINPSSITNMSEGTYGKDSRHVNPENDKWYAVPPGDNTDDEWKYPINNCQDVDDAWKLRGHGKGLSISQETLESRIKSRAKALDCPVPGEDNE